MTHAIVSAAPENGSGRPGIDADIQSAKILIVDDEPLSCRLLAGVLRKHGFTNIQFAEGGCAALALIYSSRPDLVLLDLQMPDLSGHEVCQRVRSNPELVDMPILVQTATVGRQEMGLLFAAGASDFLSKPINPAELISRVVTHLEHRKLIRELRHYRERTSQELEAARKMQLELLPSLAVQRETASAAGCRIGSFFKPSSEIGGDIWGMLPIDASSFAIFLADFVGHGVTAALNTFRLHALIHEHRALHADPVGLTSVLNERLVPLLAPGQFATFLHVVVEPRANRLRFASAGAPSPIVAAGGELPAILTEASGIPLGIAGGAQYRPHEYPFEPDARLLLFSDGLSEFPSSPGRRLGDEGLLDVINASPADLTPDEVIGHIRDAARIGADEALPDDTTIVCLDRRPASGPRAGRETAVAAIGSGHD